MRDIERRRTPLDSLDDAVLLNTTDLTEQDKHLAVGVRLVAEQVVDEGRAGVAVTTDGNTLVRAVGDEREDVIQLVGHASGLGDVADRSRAVELGSDDVIHHTAGNKSVTINEGSRKIKTYPPELPILKQPGLIPPTVAGPMMRTPLA